MRIKSAALWTRMAMLLGLLGVLLLSASSCSSSVPPAMCTAEKACPTGRVCVNEICICPAGQKDCNGTCVDIRSDAKNCGACANSCKKGQLCVGGACQCDQGQDLCGGACVDRQTSLAHCGKCGNACKNGTFCSGGVCRPDCGTLKECKGACVDTQKDQKNCGDCGNTCTGAKSCVNGKCSCAQGFEDCDGKCVDTNFSRNHCGACGNDCGKGKFCSDGRCVTECARGTKACGGGCFDINTNRNHCGDCNAACRGLKNCEGGRCNCPAGTADCNGVCVDLRTNRSNCGACGRLCPSGQICAKGRCTTNCPNKTEKVCAGGCFDTKASVQHCGACGNACQEGELCKENEKTKKGECVCPKDYIRCGGKCIDPQVSVRHCGKCDNTCKQGQRCSAGACATSCPKNTPDECYGGCVDIKSDERHCGACGKKCAALQTCDNGTCKCPQGQDFCNGACVDTQSDNIHCGKCNDACPKGKSCVKGQCEIVCPNGLKLCNGKCLDLSKDPLNCGACGGVCEAPQACIDGKCGCPKPSLLCGKNCVDPQTSRDHCGKCGDKCQDGYLCKAGKCELDCSGKDEKICSNKCVNLKTDVNNCSACGTTCKKEQICLSGKCECPASNLSLCGGSCVELQGDPKNCGSCGKACGTGERCEKGQCIRCTTNEEVCGSACCSKGFKCCNGSCEQLQGDPKNCGTCGKACGAGEVCCGGSCSKFLSDKNNCGACGKACQSGQSCCAGQCIDFKTSNTNCGTCGRRCGSGESCCNGQCLNLKTSNAFCGVCQATAACKAGQNCCGGACKDLKSDNANCGACGKVCGSGESCCNGQCVNFKTSAANCGACGKACGFGLACCNGACTDTSANKNNCGACGLTCPSGDCCGGQCTNTQGSLSNCGVCGNQCGTGQACCTGGCSDLQTDRNNCSACGKACPAGDGCCGGSCSSFRTDVNNCGGCGVRCGLGVSCCGGTCADFKSDRNNCGVCGKSCKIGELCIAGACKTCPAGAVEVCGNGVDDDCDGVIDEVGACTPTNTLSNFETYNVMSNGTIVGVNRSGTSIRVFCQDSKGQTIKSLYTLSSGGFRTEYPSVAVAKKGNFAVVAWIYLSSSSSRARTLRYQLLNDKCEKVGSTLTWPMSTTIGESQYGIDVDDNGNFAVLYRGSDSRQVHITFYDKAGGQKGVPVLVNNISDRERQCQGIGYGLRLAMAGNGLGIVSCQRHQNEPIFYRRFSWATRNFLDTAMVRIGETASSNSSYNVSHSTGINAKGDFVIHWMNNRLRKNFAKFYNATTKAFKVVEVGEQLGYSYNDMREPMHNIQLLGNDFVLSDTSRSDATLSGYYRYNASGVLVSAGRADSYTRYFRTGASNQPHIYRSGRLYKSVLDLSVGKGLCQGKVCLCSPGSRQICSVTGSSSTRLPCQNGFRVCAGDGLSFSECRGEILPSLEVCGDGIDNDCNGAIDDRCPFPKGSVSMSRGLQATDVAKDGSSVFIYNAGRRLIGQCLKPDLSVASDAFSISEHEHGIRDPIVKYHKASKRFVVMWRDARDYRFNNSTVWALRAFKADCTPATSVIYTDISANDFAVDVAIARTGEFVLVGRYDNNRKLGAWFFDSVGNLRGGKVQEIYNATDCTNFVRAAFSESLSLGVVTCQGSTSHSVRYRLINANGLIPNVSFVEVAASKNNSSYTYTHAVSFNSNNDFAIHWQSFNNYRAEAAVYDSAGKLVKHWVLPTYTARRDRGFINAWDARVETMGSDFVFRSFGYYDNDWNGYWRYSRTGVVRSVNRTNLSTRYFNTSATEVYQFNNNNSYIVKDAFDLKPAPAGSQTCPGGSCECRPGAKEECLTSSSSTSSVCKAGTRTCQSNWIWGACQGEVQPKVERCGNFLDDNCNGRVDDSCSTGYLPSAQGITDYDVADDNTAVSIYWNKRSLVATCYDSAGKAAKAHQPLSELKTNVYYPRVKISANGKYAVIGWMDNRSRTTSARSRVVFKVIDNKCNVLSGGSAISVHDTTQDWTQRYDFDVAVDNKGDVSTVFRREDNQAYIRFFTLATKKLTPTVLVDPTKRWCNLFSSALRVTVNPVNGAGAVSCQRFYTEPIYYRLFAGQKLSGTGVTAVAQSANRKSGYHHTHAIGMNSKGNLVIHWQEYSTGRYYANFYTTSLSQGQLTASLTKSITLPATGRSRRTNVWQYNHYQVWRLGDDFILSTNDRLNSRFIWYRYDASGTLVKNVSHPSSLYRYESMRCSRTKCYLIRDSRAIFTGAAKLH